jgi:nuclear pore complex protein Nup160
LVERVLAATEEGDEKTNEKVQKRAGVLREAVKRRVDGLKRLEL